MRKVKVYTENQVIKILLSMREELSDLEHEQWMSWSNYVANDNLDKLPKELIDKWVKNWKPYAELDEKTKDADRIWADKIISCLGNKFMTPAGFRKAIEDSGLVGTNFAKDNKGVKNEN